MSNQLPDLLPAVKNWIEGLDILPGGIYYRLPLKPKTAPFGRIARSGGGALPDTEVPLSRINVSVEIWGLQNKDYEIVRAAALALEQAAHAVNGPNSTNGGPATILAANVLTSFDSPDPDTGLPRYITMLSVTGRQ